VARFFSFTTIARLTAFAVLSVAALISADMLPAGTGYYRSNYILPPDVIKNGIELAGVPIPLYKKEVSYRVVEQINYLLMDKRAAMMEWLDRASLYGTPIRKILAEEKVPPDLFYLVPLLSDVLPNSRTRSGGVGWWALGGTKEKNPLFSQWIVTNHWDDRRDPVLSTRIACAIFHWLIKRKTTDNLLLAICAYVDGTHKVDEAVKKAPGHSYWDIVMPPYSEIIIPRLVALKIIATHRDWYGIDFKTLPPLQYDYLDRLKLKKDLPLYVVAKWCGKSPRYVWELNPGVDPENGILPKPDHRNPLGFPLRVPKGNGKKVLKLLKSKGYL
jgi:hypothetical protein